MAKSFLLETFRYYPSNRSLSYWKYFATIRQIFCSVPKGQNAIVTTLLIWKARDLKGGVVLPAIFSVPL